MRGLSLKTRTLIISALVAVVIAGGTSLVTYAIGVRAMREASRDHVAQIAAAAEATLHQAVVEAALMSSDTTVTGESAVADAREVLFADMNAAFSRAGLTATPLALYDENLLPVWSSSAKALLPEESDARRYAQASGTTVRTETGTQTFLGGLFSGTRLGGLVLHIPSELPGGGIGVLDVSYTPAAEDAIINGVRWSMIGLMLVSALLMVILMQSSMAWVLGLVDDLRRGADSIDAGRLNERLPVKGDDEIAALAQSVNGLIERLERRSDAQSRFVADASHELATPVAGIRGYTSILRAWGADDPRVRDEAVDAIDRESRRMARLTGDLLNLLHADQGLVLKTERFDLNALCRQQLAASASRWLDKDIEYVGPDEAPLAMVGDPDRVEDVLSILLDNASKYTPFQGSICVTTRRRRETVSLEVADTGQGIPEADLAHVFDRFYRSEVSRAAGEGGFGLGLAIAKSIVVSMGGEVSVESVVGQGTTFAVKLPRGRT
jgi:signal transduction histidine kinase